MGQKVIPQLWLDGLPLGHPVLGFRHGQTERLNQGRFWLVTLNVSYPGNQPASDSVRATWMEEKALNLEYRSDQRPQQQSYLPTAPEKRWEHQSGRYRCTLFYSIVFASVLLLCHHGPDVTLSGWLGSKHQLTNFGTVAVLIDALEV